MKINGTIKDAVEEKPIAGAKIKLYIGTKEKEIAELKSDRNGVFYFKDRTSPIGDTLICVVEKEGYKDKEERLKITKDEIEKNIELDPEVVELEFSVKDKDNNPLEGVDINLVKPKNEGVSNSDGECKFAIERKYKGKTIKYRAEKDDYHTVKGEVCPKEKTHLEIIMKKSEPCWWKKHWKKVAAGISGPALIALIVFLVYEFISRPKIEFFKASHHEITLGKSSTLSWATSNAETVKISDIGEVESDGDEVVRPRKTTTYILTAIGDKDKKKKKKVTVKVIPIAKLPRVESFTAHPVIIRKKGESSTLSWKTSNAETVKISDIGDVESDGHKVVSPKKTKTYILTAKNKDGVKKRSVTVKLIWPLTTTIFPPTTLTTTTAITPTPDDIVPEITSFYAFPQVIRPGESSTLEWATENADEVRTSDIGRVELSGKHRVSPDVTTTYTLTAINNKSGEKVEKEVIVGVTTIYQKEKEAK